MPHPYRVPASPLLPPNPLPPSELDEVVVVEAKSDFVKKYLGWKGFVSLVSKNPPEKAVYLVSFVGKGREIFCGFFRDDEIEVVKRYKR